MSENELQILLRKEKMLAVYKPGGVLTQAPPSIDSMERRVRSFLERETNSDDRYLATPHRLDRPVSGVILFGASKAAGRSLHLQFERREVVKTYVAVLEGKLEQSSAEWVDYLRKVVDEPRVEACEPTDAGAQEARLRFRKIGESGGGTVVEIDLLTGRMHQIRLQFSRRGFPIWGDAMYGGQKPLGEHWEDPRQRCIALHAREIKFKLPVSREPVCVVAPFPDYWPTGR